MVTKNSIGSNIPIEISKGGVNSTSFSTSTGIVKFDGTNLITSTTAKINVSNICTNTAQPAFFAYNSTQVNNLLGDGNEHTIPFDTVVFDQTSSFNTGTYTFTAPVTGKYLFIVSILVSPMLTSKTISWSLFTTPKNYVLGNYNLSFNPMPLGISTVVNLSATNTVLVSANAATGSKTIGIYGSNSSATCKTYFCGFLLC